MAARITDEEGDKLSPENFETHSLLRAVDAVDELRDDLNDGECATPPQLRLLKLYRLAMAVINEGSRRQVADLFDPADDPNARSYTHEEVMQAMQERIDHVRDKPR